MRFIFIILSALSLSSCLKDCDKKEIVVKNLTRFFNFNERFFYYSQSFLGTKYPKNDPVKNQYYNLKEMNCITYIQNLLALSISNNFQEFEKNIIKMSYLTSKKPDYLLDRYHFTVDYIEKNAQYFQDKTEIIASKNLLSKRNIEINYNNFFKLHEIETNLKNKETSLRYLSKDNFAKISNNIKRKLIKDKFYILLLIPTNEYFNYIKENYKIEIDIHHLGILFLKDNEIYFRHAGFVSEDFKNIDLKTIQQMSIKEYLKFSHSLAGEVTQLPFNDYMKFSRLFEGMIFLKLKEYENHN